MMNDLNKGNISELKTKKDTHWLLKGLMMMAWILLFIVAILAFYQVLPVTLLVLGQSLGMLGTRDGLPSVVDIAIFILTGMSVTLMSTYSLMQILKYILNHIKKLHLEAYAQIRNQVSMRQTKRNERKNNKKEKDV